MTGNEVAQMSDYATGLEDLDPGEMGVPRISVIHKEGIFKENTSGEQFAVIRGIVLGLIKQRVMWAPDVEDMSKAKPLCKSNDAAVGYPRVDGGPDENFPWGDSGLNPDAMPRDEAGKVTIACEACPFTQWGKNPKTGKPVPPICKERYTLPVMYSTDENWKPGQPLLSAGIVAFQGSGVKPTRGFLGLFARSRLPVYSSYAEITLNLMKRGAVDYSVPEFKRLSSIPQEDWADLSEEYRNIRDHLRTPPRSNDDPGDPAKQQTSTGSVPAASTEQSITKASEIVDAVVVEESPFEPTATTEAVGSVEDDDLPF